jgi:hypothetical protein
MHSSQRRTAVVPGNPFVHMTPHELICNGSGHEVSGHCPDSGQEHYLAKGWPEAPLGTGATTFSCAGAVLHQASTPVPRLPRPAGREIAGSTRMPPRPSTPESAIVSCFLLDTGHLLE